MPGGNKNIRPEDCTNGFDKNPQNINRNGTPVSIKKQIKELLSSDGVMKIEWKNVVKVVEGDHIEINIPKKDMVVMKLFAWAMGKNPSASTRAIQMIIEHMDGKPHQSMSIDSSEPIQQISLTDEQVDKILKEVKPKTK